MSRDKRSGRGFTSFGEPFDTAKNVSNVDWKLGLEYDITDRTMIYGIVQTGYQPGTYNTLPRTPSQSNIVAAADLTAFAVGIKNRFAEDRVQLTPDDRANMSIGYLRARVDSRYESRFWAGYAPTRGTQQKPYVKSDASLTHYGSRGWSAGLWIRNIENRPVQAATAGGMGKWGAAFLVAPRTLETILTSPAGLQQSGSGRLSKAVGQFHGRAGSSGRARLAARHRRWSSVVSRIRPSRWVQPQRMRRLRTLGYGVRTLGGLKVIVAIVRRQGISAQAFHEHWRGPHASLMVACPASRRYLRRYLQCHTIPGQGEVEDPAFDGVAELWFDLIEDKERFADLQRTKFILSQEEPVI